MSGVILAFSSLATPNDTQLVFGDPPAPAEAEADGINLVFRWPVSDGTELVFGDPPAPDGAILATAAATLPAPVLPALGFAAVADSRLEITATLAATLPVPVLPLVLAGLDATVLAGLDASLPVPVLGLSAVVAGSIILDLPDADGASIALPSAHAPKTASGMTAGQQEAIRAPIPQSIQAQQAWQTAVGLVAAGQEMTRTTHKSDCPHQHGMPLSGRMGARHGESLRTRRHLTQAHQHGIHINASTAFAYAECIRIRPGQHQPHQHGIPIRAGTVTAQQHGLKTATGRGLRHQQMIQLPVGWWQATYPWPSPPPPFAHNNPINLAFCRLYDGSAAIIFCCQPPIPKPDAVIPILEVYIVANTFTLVRTSDNTPIEALSFNASLDRDSWGWSFNASIDASYLPIVRPESAGAPVQVTATINGTAIHFLVENISRNRQFASSSLSISGRSRAAYLAAPYSPTLDFYNAAQRTAQQLINDALTVNGVPLGWTLNWNITDWNVPAGAWSHTGSYIDAVIRVAGAGGAYVQAHDTADELIILPHYPLTPWNWSNGTPDFNIPEDIITVEGIEWTEKPAYNAVWVVGGTGGRKDSIKRTGSAADRPAPTIVDALATDIDMTRQRGTPVLSDTGRQALISLSLPVLPETGIIRPGALVDYTENATTRRGLVRGVNINHTFPSLQQTIQVETHELEPV